jgi:hypothetical protein
MAVGGRSVPHTGRCTPWKDSLPIVKEARCAPWPVWMGVYNFAPHRDSISGPQPIASRYTDRAISAYVIFHTSKKKILLLKINISLGEGNYKQNFNLSKFKEQTMLKIYIAR